MFIISDLVNHEPEPDPTDEDVMGQFCTGISVQAVDCGVETCM